MFRILRRYLHHHIRIRELTTIHVNVCVVLQFQNPHLKSISNIPESKNTQSITVDYLIKSCGLSPETAFSASKKIRFSSTEKPNSVLTYFQNQGLNKTQITELISKRPSILSLDPDEVLQPKINFLRDLGISGPNLAKLLASDPTLLSRSLQNQLIPSFNFLKSFIGTDANILATLKRSTWIFQCNLDKVMRPNIVILRDHGVPESNILKFIMTDPRTLMYKTDRFKEIVEEIKKMGFNLSSMMFVYAVRAMGGLSKLRWEEKLAFFRSLGWSDDEILSLFKKQPMCMTSSEDKIRRSLEFFIEKLKWKREDIFINPTILRLSLEKRIIPRCAVLEILCSKGVIRRKFCVSSVLTLAEKKFLGRFVMKYHETIPEVVIAYKGEIEFAGFGQLSRFKEL